MTEEAYSNRELDHMFKEMHEKLDTIIKQVTKTNGRVTTLEKWRYTIAGAGLVLGAISIPNIGTIINIITSK